MGWGREGGLVPLLPHVPVEVVAVGGFILPLVQRLRAQLLPMGFRLRIVPLPVRVIGELAGGFRVGVGEFVGGNVHRPPKAAGGPVPHGALFAHLLIDGLPVLVAEGGVGFPVLGEVTEEVGPVAVRSGEVAREAGVAGGESVGGGDAHDQMVHRIRWNASGQAEESEKRSTRAWPPVTRARTRASDTKPLES